MKTKAIALAVTAIVFACGCDSSHRYESVTSQENGTAKAWKAHLRWLDGSTKEVQVKQWREMSQNDAPHEAYMDRDFEAKFMTLVTADGKTYVVLYRDVVLVKE